MPACCASLLLLRSSATPAASVTAAATVKIVAARAVPMPRRGASSLRFVVRVPRGISCPGGAR
jgi:hypothetical protein